MNKKGFLNIIIAVIVAAVIAGGVYFITRNPQSIHSDWKTYTDETIGISLKYPPELGNPSKNILSTSTEIDFKGTTGNSTLLSIRSGVYYNQDLGRPMTVAELTAGKGISNITVAGKEAVRVDSLNESTIYISQDAKGNILTISAKVDLLNQIIPTIIIQTTPSDWKTFSYDEYGFNISLPPDYILSGGSRTGDERVASFSVGNPEYTGDFNIYIYGPDSKYESRNPVVSEEAVTINGSAGKKIVTKYIDFFSKKEVLCPFYEFRTSEYTYRFFGHEQCFEGDTLMNMLNTFKLISPLPTIQVDFFPAQVGQCQMTTVKEIGTWNYHNYVSYSNGGSQNFSSDYVIKGFNVGDPVNFCYVGHADPSTCEELGANPGDLRPYVYRANNLNTGAEIEGSPNLHMCSGA